MAPRVFPRRSPATGSDRSPMLVGSDDDEELDNYDNFLADQQKLKRARTIRQDMARDLPHHALKELDKMGYTEAAPLRFTHAAEIVSFSRGAADDGEDQDGRKKNCNIVASQAVKRVFPLATDEESTIELQYPASLTRERYADSYALSLCTIILTMLALQVRSRLDQWLDESS